MILALLVTFACGAAYELGCVFWVHYSEQNRTSLAVAWSCFNALVTVVGIGEALHEPAAVATYVAGYGVGTYTAIKIKARWRQPSQHKGATAAAHNEGKGNAE